MLQLANGKQQFLDQDGAPLAGGLVYHYAPGTTTPVATYQDSAGQSANTNPIQLDSRGQAIIWGTGMFRQVVTDPSGVTIWDQVVNASDVTAAATGLQTELAASTGSSLVGFLQNAAGSAARWVQDKLRERVSVFDFMTAAQIADVQARTATLDLSTALQAACAYIGTNSAKLVFPPGTYLYSTSPNWAIQNATIEFEGDVRFRYTGAGNAVTIDANAAGAVVTTAGLCYGTRFGWGNGPIIEALSTSQNGFYVRGMQRSKIGGRVRGAGSTSAGLYVAFAVSSQFDIPVSVNYDGWYNGAAPEYGYNLDKRNAGETTSYCTFVNPIVEGVTIGVQLLSTLGNTFLGGTFEGCSQYGLFASAGALQDKFIGTDFEANTLADVYDLGTGLVLDKCDTQKQLSLGSTSKNATVLGGHHSNVLSDTGSLRATLKDLVFNRLNNGSTLTDAGTGTLIDNCRNGGTNTTYLTGSTAVTAATIANNSLGVTSIPVTGAKLGDFVLVAFDGGGLGAMITWGVINTAGTVTAYCFNNTGASINVPAGNWRATVLRR